MFIIGIVVVLTLVISGSARWRGASKKKAVAVGLIPTVIALSGLALSDGLELGRHGAIPAWVTVLIAFGVSLVPATVAAVLMPRKEPIQLPETTRGK